jgi:hypothetical protein
MEEEKKLIDKTIKDGGVYAALYFDVYTRTKEKAQEMGAGFIQQLLKEPGVIYAIGEIDEPIQAEDLFSTTVNVKILTVSLPHLTNVVAIHSPFSAEVLKPDEITLPLNQVHELLTNVAQVTSDYKKYILEKLTSKEDLEKYKKILEKKAEAGKKILEEKGLKPVEEPLKTEGFQESTAKPSKVSKSDSETVNEANENEKRDS